MGKPGAWARILTCGCCAVLCAGLSAPACADEMLDAVDSGNYDQDGDHSHNNTNYLTGDTAAAGVAENRAFFVFDLSAVHEQIVGARLTAYNPGLVPDDHDGFTSPDAYETLTVFDVATDVATLRAGGSGLIAIFDDLGGGPSYGSVDVDEQCNATMVSVTLNQDALDALNLATGEFAFGTALTTLAGNPSQYVFGYTSAAYQRSLILYYESIFSDGFEDGHTVDWSDTVD